MNLINLQERKENDCLARASRTLSFINRALADFDLAVTGSYAEYILKNQRNSSFNENSDIDIAVENKYMNMAREVIIKSLAPRRIMETRDYKDGEGGGGKVRYRTFKNHLEFKILSENHTPIHLIGTYDPKQHSEIVRGVRYINPIRVKDMRLIVQ